MQQRSCRTCFHADAARGGAPEDGYCTKKPPTLVMIDARQSGAYPPVNLDHFRCGDHTPKSWLRRVWRGIVGP